MSHTAPVRLRAIQAAACVSVAAATAAAQTTIWKTNYYDVAGSTFRDLRESMTKARPWHDNFDAYTAWDIKWNYTLTSHPAACAVTAVRTTTTITTTLPRWTSQTNASTETIDRWRRFLTQLGTHEYGHGQIATAAASELHKTISTIATENDCPSMNRHVEECALRIVAAYREREREYDRRTGHGAIGAR